MGNVPPGMGGEGAPSGENNNPNKGASKDEQDKKKKSDSSPVPAPLVSAANVAQVRRAYSAFLLSCPHPSASSA